MRGDDDARTATGGYVHFESAGPFRAIRTASLLAIGAQRHHVPCAQYCGIGFDAVLTIKELQACVNMLVPHLVPPEKLKRRRGGQIDIPAEAGHGLIGGQDLQPLEAVSCETNSIIGPRYTNGV